MPYANVLIPTSLLLSISIKSGASDDIEKLLISTILSLSFAGTPLIDPVGWFGYFELKASATIVTI